MSEYEPELGQFYFGQPFQRYEASNLLIAALHEIEYELDRVMHNVTQKEYNSPFGNTGNSFKCDVFEVQAYSWDDEAEQPYNFRWRDVEVSWYKYLGRGTSVNVELSPERIAEMLEDCLSAIVKMDTDDFERGKANDKI